MVLEDSGRERLREQQGQRHHTPAEDKERDVGEVSMYCSGGVGKRSAATDLIASTVLSGRCTSWKLSLIAFGSTIVPTIFCSCFVSFGSFLTASTTRSGPRSTSSSPSSPSVDLDDAPVLAGLGIAGCLATHVLNPSSAFARARKAV